MRSYPIPPEGDDKEKIIGGVLDMRQFVWLAVGFVVSLIIVVITYAFMGVLSFILGFMIGAISLPFAFYTKHGLTLGELLARQRAFDKKTKLLPNEIKIKK